MLEFNDLPAEVICLVFGPLTKDELCAASLVCTLWRDLIDDGCWQQLCTQTFDARHLFVETYGGMWKKMSLDSNMRNMLRWDKEISNAKMVVTEHDLVVTSSAPGYQTARMIRGFSTGKHVVTIEFTANSSANDFGCCSEMFSCDNYLWNDPEAVRPDSSHRMTADGLYQLRIDCDRRTVQFGKTIVLEDKTLDCEYESGDIHVRFEGPIYPAISFFNGDASARIKHHHSEAGSPESPGESPELNPEKAQPVVETIARTEVGVIHGYGGARGTHVPKKEKAKWKRATSRQEPG